MAPADRHGTPLLVLFGSNLGASEDIASRIARDATDRGYTARTAGLDDAVAELPTEGAVVVVTSSYNGQPPDNAAKFCTWIDDPTVAGVGSKTVRSMFRVGSAVASVGRARTAAKAAREDFTGDRGGCSRPERGDGLKGAAILVADRKPIEQVLDRGQPDALEIRRTSGAHALQVLKRRIERYRRQMLKVADGAYCTTIDVPVPTRISFVALVCLSGDERPRASPTARTKIIICGLGDPAYSRHA